MTGANTYQVLAEPGHMYVCLLCLYVVLSCVGRGLCDGLITRPTESYHVSFALRNLRCEAVKVLTMTPEPLMMMMMMMMIMSHETGSLDIKPFPCYIEISGLEKLGFLVS
jgi:hypothetical protein